MPDHDFSIHGLNILVKPFQAPRRIHDINMNMIH